MITLEMRAPGQTISLGGLFARLPFLGSANEGFPAEIKSVRVEGKEAEGDLSSFSLQPGIRVEAEWDAPLPSAGNSRVRRIAEAGSCFCLELPIGATGDSTHPGFTETMNLIAGEIVYGTKSLNLLYSGGPDVGGLWIVGGPDEGELSSALRKGDFSIQCRALVEAVPWTEGVLETGLDGKKARTHFRMVERRGDIAEISFEVRSQAALQIRRHAAAAGMPVLGDALFGGRIVRGGLRLYTSTIDCPELGLELRFPPPDKFWPDEEVFPEDPTGKPFLMHRISRATIKALKRGHPWILPDEESGDAGRFASGTRVALVGRDGERVGEALIEGKGRVDAQVWCLSQDNNAVPNELEERVAQSLRRRKKLLEALQKNSQVRAFRLIHGAADHLPGLSVDFVDGVLRAIVHGWSALQYREEVYGFLVKALGTALPVNPPVIEVLNLRPRAKGRLDSVRLVRGELPQAQAEEISSMILEEDGLSFLVNMGLDHPSHPAPGIGFFLDQRENRHRLKARIQRGEHWLNLFCHTGAFSVVLLANGAGHVVSVDLSQRYLSWLEQNLRLNNLDVRAHSSIRSDARRFLDSADRNRLFDGIIVDPPTAAAVGRKFWSLKKGYAEVVRGALPLLKPGGSLLLFRNDRGSRGSLESLLKKEAKAQGRIVVHVERADPSWDFPILDPFPEGDAFTGIIARLR